MKAALPLLLAALVGFLAVWFAWPRDDVPAPTPTSAPAPQPDPGPTHTPGPDESSTQVVFEGSAETQRLRREWEEAVRRALPTQPAAGLDSLDSVFAMLNDVPPDYVAFGVELYDLLRRNRGLVPQIAGRFFRATDPQALFQIGRALNPFIGGHESEWIESLLGADDLHREMGLYALHARAEGVIVAHVLNAFQNDPADPVRTTAAFMMSDAIGDLSPELRESAWSTARSNLEAGAADDMTEYCLDILATKPLTGEEAELVTGIWRASDSPSVRWTAARTLVEGGSPEAARPVLSTMLSDPSLPPDMRDSIRAMLERIGR